MNYGGDAADQIVRYSMEGMEHTLRISGSIAKNLAVLIVAVMKDQKKTRGKTNLLRMLKEQRAMKFFTIPHDRLREFAEKTEAKEELPAKTEKVVLPEGTIEFELDEEEHLFDVGEVSPSEENFTQAEKAGNLSGPSSHSSGSFSGQETSWKGEKPSVRQELKKIETEQKQRQKQQQSRRKPRNQQRREQKKVKGR